MAGFIIPGFGRPRQELSNSREPGLRIEPLSLGSKWDVYVLLPRSRAHPRKEGEGQVKSSGKAMWVAHMFNPSPQETEASGAR